MNTGFSRTQHSLSEHPRDDKLYTTTVFSFYRHRPIQLIFPAGRSAVTPVCCLCVLSTSAMDSLVVWQNAISDSRERMSVFVTPCLSLFRQRLYQIIAGYEDANDADRLAP